ncbi:MAG: PQQ-binding-like beta-propeller repeat protein [Vicinamibacterales bacterium]
MTSGRWALAIFAISGMAGGWSAARAQQGATYTDQQAAAGQAAYAQSCGGCHGSTLSGGGEAPPLAGSVFMDTWGPHTTRELFTRIRESMPPENPNGLSADTYASIVAFLLKANGAQAGARAFTLETSVPIASIANGRTPAGLTAGGAAPARGGRGRGGRGRGGADDDSTAPTAPRTGLTVTGTAKNYSTITDDMLARPPDSDWLMHYRNYAGWNYSPLSQITTRNVGGLQLKWAWPLEDGMRQQITPIVHDGVMFLSTNMTNTVQALDARTGDLIWEHRLGPTGTTGQNATRTMALYGNLLFYPATDATLYALDARTGNVVWKNKVSEFPDDKIGGIMMAREKLLVGLTRCNDLDARNHCFIAGYDALTGKLVWKFYTVARKGVPGGDTWGDLTDDQRSGADAWIAGTYDPQLNLAFWGTGQAKGSRRDQRGPNGDALYSNTTLALDPDTGKLKWYFQNAPGETLDLDEVFERVLIDHGQQKTVMTVGKSGLMWKLDRITGKFLDVKETVFQNVWASIDMKTGRTTYRDDILEKKPGEAVASCPSPSGGHNWQATTYDPSNDLLIIPLSQNCAMYGGGPQLFYEMPGTDGNLGRLSAYETNTMRPVWSFQQRSPFLTGAISTAGGVGFVGDFNRVFRAFDVKTGKTLWETRLPTTAQGYPVTFSVGGDQFVAVPTGYNGGSPEQKPTTMLRGEVQRPTIGHGVYVFGLPRATAQ